jgi:hypothetical protein
LEGLGLHFTAGRPEIALTYLQTPFWCI